MNGIFNILKPPGMTSHDVVNRVRRLTAIKRCGHTGTLDPGAAGILPVCVGSATRVSEYVLDMEKVYRAELCLGTATDTEDAAGNVIDEAAVPKLDESIINGTLRQFLGQISQVPPMYSAVRQEGKKLYELARRGETVERKPRQVKIYSLELLKYYNGKILFDVTCSSGTYVRTLCVDIAVNLGTAGHLCFLLRRAVGPFLLEKSFTLEELANLQERDSLTEALLPTDMALQHFPSVNVTEEQAAGIMHGQSLASDLDNPGQLPVRIYGPQGVLLAVARQSNGLLKPQKVFINPMERG